MNYFFNFSFYLCYFHSLCSFYTNLISFLFYDHILVTYFVGFSVNIDDAVGMDIYGLDR